MTHALNLFPWSLWMCITEFRRKHICSFSYNHYVINDGMVAHHVCEKLLFANAFGICFDISYGLKYVS